MTQDQELSEILDDYYAPIVLPDINRTGLKQAIEAYVTTRVKEAERLARIDELDKYNDSPLDWFYYEERRRSELKALTTTTNGNKE